MDSKEYDMHCAEFFQNAMKSKPSSLPEENSGFYVKNATSDKKNIDIVSRLVQEADICYMKIS